MDTCKLDEMVIPISAAVQGVVSLLKTLNIAPSSCFATFGEYFTSELVCEDNRSSLLLPGKANSIPSQCCRSSSIRQYLDVTDVPQHVILVQYTDDIVIGPHKQEITGTLNALVRHVQCRAGR